MMIAVCDELWSAEEASMADAFEWRGVEDGYCNPYAGEFALVEWPPNDYAVARDGRRIFLYAARVPDSPDMVFIMSDIPLELPFLQAWPVAGWASAALPKVKP